MSTPWLGLFGDADHGIPVEDVERLRAELTDRAPVETAIVRYPDAEHGFHCDARPSYSADRRRRRRGDGPWPGWTVTWPARAP